MAKAMWSAEEVVGWRYVHVVEVEWDGLNRARAKTVDGEWVECVDVVLRDRGNGRPQEVWALAVPEYGED
jgi:hypothetical protein